MDGSQTPHRLQTTLTAAQEVVVVERRRLHLDDPLVMNRDFTNPKVSRNSLDRRLRRHGVSGQKDLKPRPENAAKETFRDYEPRFVHVDITYLLQTPDERKRQYLFVAIDGPFGGIVALKLSKLAPGPS